MDSISIRNAREGKQKMPNDESGVPPLSPAIAAPKPEWEGPAQAGNIGAAEWRRTSIMRKVGPLEAGHPYLARPVTRCAACQEFLEVGDFYTLVTLGPGLDVEQQRKCRDFLAYNAFAAVVHWTCATGLPA